MSHHQVALSDNKPTREGSVRTSGYIAVGRSGSNAYSNSSATGFTAGSQLYFYDTNPINEIGGATITSSNNWVESVTLPAGVYTIDLCFGAEFSASGYMQFAPYISSTAQPSNGSCGASATHERGASIAQAFIELSSSTTITFNVYDSSNVDSVANQGTTPSQESWFLIRKTTKQ